LPFANLANPQTLNLYAYVQGNPLNGVDPDGHEDCTQSDPNKPCFSTTVKEKKKKGSKRSSSNNAWGDYGGGIFLGAAVGNHFIPEWRNLNQSTWWYQFSSRWVSGPRVKNWVNRYDWLHRLYNPAVRELITNYAKTAGKSIEDLGPGDAKAIQQEMVEEAKGGNLAISNFLDRLQYYNPNAIQVGDNIDAIADKATDVLQGAEEAVEPVLQQVDEGLFELNQAAEPLLGAVE
jgi:hypothetical protein